MANINLSDGSLQGVLDISGQRALEIDITYACNMRCIQCNRALGIFPSTERMTVEQIEMILHESLILTKPFRMIRILGGEPTLHPHIVDIVDVLEKYYTLVENCEISLWTNGGGNHVKSVLAMLPPWIRVRTSPKKLKLGGESFEPFLVAPIDYPSYHDNDFSNGCKHIAPGKCGVGVSIYGVYVCPIAAAIDRIVRLNIGIKNLAEVSNINFRQQCEQLCQFCGHFLFDRGVKFDLATISSTWKKLLIEHKANERKLTSF